MERGREEGKGKGKEGKRWRDGRITHPQKNSGYGLGEIRNP